MENEQQAVWQRAQGVTITRTAETKRGRIALFENEEFLFSVDAETFAAEGLGTGQSLSGEELRRLHDKSETRKACDKALQYLSLRDHASGELYQKLRTRFDPESCAAAVAKMRALALIDDENFARHRVAYMLGQNKSPRAIAAALAQKGLDRETVQQALDEAEQAARQNGEDPQQKALDTLIEKHYRRPLAQGRVQNVTAALCRRGFSMAAVREALERYQTGTEEDIY